MFLFLCFFTFASLQGQTASVKVMKPPESDMVIVAAAMEHTEPKWIGKEAFVKVYRASRGDEPSLNGVIPILKDLPVDVNITYSALRKLSNKWRESFIKGHVPLCFCLRSKVPFYRYFFDYTDFPRDCPVPKGNYTIDHMKLLVGGDLSTISSTRDWRARMSFVVGDTPILTFSFDYRFRDKLPKKIQRPQQGRQ